MTEHNVPDDEDDQRPESTALLRHGFDPRRDSASEELVRAVAAVDDADPIDLPVLAEAVDPEALDRLFGRRPDGAPRDTDGRIRFEYSGHRILVASDGTIAIDPCESAGDD
ncbi:MULTISPECIES: HalOD1 output domain-containing protein [Halorussus]|uniref:HalOD1 output domain-containing protein n=1 Tax=Halorussus TaxID=1070314 RepID=UPI0013B47000|nr:MULTISPECIES: HalOD1 output domain-containing protein [Halorussus]NHN58300.1 hypothetical protein [Halorussus sp. JP-T4]